MKWFGIISLWFVYSIFMVLWRLCDLYFWNVWLFTWFCNCILYQDVKPILSIMVDIWNEKYYALICECLCSMFETWMIYERFHVFWCWYVVRDSLQWRSPHLAYRGITADLYVTHIRKRLQSLNRTKLDWDPPSHHTRLSETNAKKGYLVL